MVLYGDTNVLIHIQADAPQPQVITLIDPTTQKPLDPQRVKTTPDGQVQLQAGNIIYLLRNGELQKQRYPMIVTDQLTVEDFTLANDGTVYVLLVGLSGVDSLVEKIGVDGRQVFTKLPSHHQAEQGREDYYSLEVDVRGRLWVAGGIPSFVRVMEPNWAGLAHEIVEYNQYNSNYQNGLESNLLRTSDGRIWAAKYHLVWTDSNVDDLPPPLPDWLAWARQPESTLPFVLALSFLVLILLVIINRKFWRKFLLQRK
jgi:hypothetical protein